MSLFVDSSAWISLFADNDKYHQISSQAFTALNADPQFLFTSDYVIDETLTHILITYGRPHALRFGRWVLSTSNVEILKVDETVWQDAWDMFQSYEDKQWAFTDCTSFVLMRQHNLHRAFTFDHHFEQAGFQLWPGMGE